MKLIFVLFVAALLGITGCNKEVAATVNCKVTEDLTVDCTIEQTKGTAELEVCWEFKVTCANGATLEAARTCGSVKDGQSTQTTIPRDKVNVSGPCDAVKEAVIANTTWKAGGAEANQ